MEKTDFQYENIRDFCIEFTIWNNSKKAKKEFHEYNPGEEKVELNDRGGYIWKKFNTSTCQYYYQVTINKLKTPGSGSVIYVILCYAFDNYQVHTFISYEMKEYEIEDLLELNIVSYDMLEHFPGWSPQAENVFDEFIRSI